MYSCITNVNILTSLLISHGIKEAVVCPGAHNAALAHNLNECGSIRCQAVTDERSAGFVALGMAIQLGRPVAVCVTSGSALLNLLPAVAEAFYQQVPLVIISADRPQAWIDQLDGQTLPQPDALGRFVRYAANLPEPTDDTQHWYCNRLVNEALLATIHPTAGPVHINVPISRDLHNFCKNELPRERKIFSSGGKKILPETGHPLYDAFSKARRRLIVIGQVAQSTAQPLTPHLKALAKNSMVVHECLGGDAFLPCPIDAVISKENEMLQPDFILYLGRTLVSKPFKLWIRRQKAECWMVNATGKVEDVTGFLTGIVEAGEKEVLLRLSTLNPCSDTHYLTEWNTAMEKSKAHAMKADLPWSQACIVRAFEQRIKEEGTNRTVCYANSSAVRLANLFSTHYCQCNRGVNGIEGSLSTAAGISLASNGGRTYCVIGDLSFFYDQNALWIQGLGENLRILLLNNGGGGIFTRFDGLRNSQARESLIMARHCTSARGICQSYGIDYMDVSDAAQLADGLDFLCRDKAEGPRLLEVFTEMESDQLALDILNKL